MRKLQKRRTNLGARTPNAVERLEDRRLLSGGASFDLGTNNAMAMASDGTLYVAYFRPTGTSTGDLRYAIRNADGTWRANGTDGGIIDDSSAFVGASVSMGLDSTGKPGIAYTDSTNADLKYAHWNGTSWDVGLVGSTTGKRGNYPSIAYLNNKPTISHFVKTNLGGYLSVDQNTSLNPSTSTSWSTTQIDASGDAGRYSTIVYNANTSKWGIAYTDSVLLTRGARYVESSGSSVTTGWGLPVIVPQPVGSNSSQAWWSSLVYDANNKPAFAWYNDADADLIFSHRNGLLNGWNSVRVDAGLITGRNPNLRINSAGDFSIVYYDQGHSEVELRDGGDTNVAWTVQPDLATGVADDLRLIYRNGVNLYSFSNDDALYVTDDQSGTAWGEEFLTGTPFTGRLKHASAVFDDGDTAHPGTEMWVMGGINGGGPRNDVYASNDGAAWRRVVDNGGSTGFTARQSAASVAFDGKLWVLGGQAGTTDSANVGDVWSTQDGANWTKAQSGGVDVDFGARRDHAAVAFNGKMFVIGGVSASGGAPANAMVSSADGLTWSTVSGGATAAANRVESVALVYNNSIYLMGGTGSTTPQTYRSDSTGTTWTAVPGTPDFNVVGGAGAVYDGKMWVVTGANAHWSTDGVHWNLVQAAGAVPFDGRVGATALTFARAGEGNRLWFIGGYVNLGRDYQDEVWSTN
jgi:hypothetical protein